MTMFGEAKYSYLSRIISLESPTAARRSVAMLRSGFQEAKTRAKKLRIARATQLAANRAKVMAGNVRLSGAERAGKKKVAEMYNNAARVMFNKL